MSAKRGRAGVTARADAVPSSHPALQDILGSHPEQVLTGKAALDIMSEVDKVMNPEGPKTELESMTAKDYYFESYSHFGIHEEMLKDEVRTKSYRDAIMQNGHLFRDKVVLDVGCGTGILCMFAAQSGARRVIGVDMSSIIEQAGAIVNANGFSDTITLVRGKVEEIELPHGIQKVDIIISEWMGYCLLYESMLDTVLFARDKWLAPGGIMLPDKAVMYVCGIEDSEYKQTKINFWDSVYGFDMSCIKKIALTEPLVDTVEAQQIATRVCSFKSIDMSTCTKDDLAFSVPYRFAATRNDFIHALVVYWDCGFTKGHKEIWFSTSPRSRTTHWRQTVFYLQEHLACSNGEVCLPCCVVSHNLINVADDFFFRLSKAISRLCQIKKTTVTWT
jgi:protein arginine N-methyltransferase 1